MGEGWERGGFGDPHRTNPSIEAPGTTGFISFHILPLLQDRKSPERKGQLGSWAHVLARAGQVAKITDKGETGNSAKGNHGATTRSGGGAKEHDHTCLLHFSLLV